MEFAIYIVLVVLVLVWLDLRKGIKTVLDDMEEANTEENVDWKERAETWHSRYVLALGAGKPKTAEDEDTDFLLGKAHNLISRLSNIGRGEISAEADLWLLQYKEWCEK